MRNTFHGAIGFFDQRNMKVNHKNPTNAYNGIDKYQQNDVRKPK
jgi:hypothetical protein